MKACEGQIGRVFVIRLEAWLVGEVILYEILGADMLRVKDKQSGFELLEPGT